MRYIVLDGSKRPTEKLSDGGKPLEAVKDFRNVGVLVPEPYIVLDFDTKTDAEIMLHVAEDLDLKCLIMQTTRGYHFWFKSPDPWKNFKKTRLAIGIYADCRSYGKLSYVVVKKDGEWRKWIKTVPADEIADVPCWLKPLSSEKYKFKEMKDGDGRNQSLYEYILVMQSKGYNREQIRKTISIINQYVLKDSLSARELATVLRDESFRDESELVRDIALSECFDADGGFLHNMFAQLLANNLNIITINEQCYLYEDGYYKRADRNIDKEMVRLYPTCRKNQRAEVIDYIKILTTVDRESIRTEEYIINLKNTRLDVRTNEMLPFDPAIIDFARIPVTYDPDAYCADLDKMLNKVFCHDRQVIDLFEEMVGYLLIKNCRFRKGFMFYGSGSNGKSTILNLLKKFIGDDNLSTVEMDKLADPFMAAELENKIANIGDDIDAKDIIDTGTIKKLCTGESMTVHRKYGQPFVLKNYAKLIFSCNTLPRIADKSEGMYSRLMFIPFKATFTSEDEDFDPFIEDKVTTDEALSYLLNIGLRGLRRLLHNNRFTYPDVVQQSQEDYKVDNSNVLTWVEEEGLTEKDLMGDTTDKLFSAFNDWCTRNNIKYPASIRTFHKDIEDRYGLERKRIRNFDTGNRYKWMFQVKLD